MPSHEQNDEREPGAAEVTMIVVPEDKVEDAMKALETLGGPSTRETGTNCYDTKNGDVKCPDKDK